jgi:hypothetical protein
VKHASLAIGATMLALAGPSLVREPPDYPAPAHAAERRADSRWNHGQWGSGSWSGNGWASSRWQRAYPQLARRYDRPLGCR